MEYSLAQHLSIYGETMAKLKPRARIIRTIGDQLISGPEASIIELVKNSYDADAEWVNIKISPPNEKYLNGLVEVKDNGHGMTSSELVNMWFEPATDDKKIKKFSRKKRRKLLGAKGIGRFASACLGHVAEIDTKAEDLSNDFEHTKLKVNWRDFESNKYLDEIDIPLFSEYGIFSETGLTMKITDIKIKWTRNVIENIVRELRRITSPKDYQSDFKIYLDVSDFVRNGEADEPNNFNGQEILEKEYLSELTDNQDIYISDPTLIIPYKMQDKADYSLQGIFNEDGDFSGSFTIDRGDGVPKILEVKSPIIENDEKKCGLIEIELKIYDLEKESVQGLFKRMNLDFDKFGLKRARDLIKEFTGIGIYRDGFRIRPYGEADYDWLILEKRRVQDPSKKLGHSQVSGRVMIEGEEQSQLIERSSREGFEHNGSFSRLKKLITNVLIRIEEKRLEYRQNAGLSRKPTADVEKIKGVARLDKLVKAASSLPKEYKKLFIEKIEQQSIELTKAIEEIEEYQKLLESRSALGLVVAQVIHDGRRYLEPMSDAASSLIEQKDFLLEQTKKGEVVRKFYPQHAETIKTGVKGLSSLFKALDPVSGRRRGKPNNFNLFSVAQNAINFMGDSLIEHGIEVEINIHEEINLYGYISDLQSSLLNIIDNAIHWLSSDSSVERRIKIDALSDVNDVKIFLSNNGPIIEGSFRARLFNAGSTLKSEGHGLGLVIAREACRASKGELFFDEMSDETTFVIVFPKGENNNV